MFSATTSAYDAAAPDPVFAEKLVVKFPPCKANILRLTPSKNILLIKIAAKKSEYYTLSPCCWCFSLLGFWKFGKKTL